MSKNSSSQYSGGSVSVNGQNIAGNYRNGSNVNSQYNMTDNEKKLYDYIQQSFLTNLPNINVFSDDVQKQMQNQVEAYTNQGLKLLNNMYSPMLSSLKTDIANRFGNFDNSVFMDNLNNIESKRAESMSALAQDVTAKQNELYNDELAKRYNYLSFINGIQNEMDARIMDYLGIAAQNSTLGNTYNNAQAKSNSGFSSSALLTNLAQNALSAYNPAAGTIFSLL
ncbi:MAG: hypothetical protein LBK53_07315 [Heliobacteriaceae bacterium]|jgi:hypothetical protein|nr:hypothetical protein [Heliobacteriaceae bacterium]